MKKAIFSLAIIIGLSFCNNKVVAQTTQQYEYGILMSDMSSDAFAFVDGKHVLTSGHYVKSPTEGKGFKRHEIDAIYGLNEQINKLAKEGWEIVSTETTIIYFRRAVK